MLLKGGVHYKGRGYVSENTPPLCPRRQSYPPLYGVCQNGTRGGMTQVAKNEGRGWLDGVA